MYRSLVLIATALTFALVVVGAYVRLSDAGLGCPDWPGCYGHAGVPEAPRDVTRAEAAFPHAPIEPAKAWKEMGHRYLAETVGLILVAIAVIAMRTRRQGRGIALPLLLLAVVALQATLGMWTVTMLLKPAIVTAHLLGGMTLFALLLWLSLRELAPPRPSKLTLARPRSGQAPLARQLRPWALIALALVIAQIALGGWVSSNYAALACPDFPRCQGAWVPAMDFSHGFHLRRELGMTVDGELLTLPNLTAIHWVHRVGALVLFVYLGALALRLVRDTDWRKLGVTLGVALIVQISLGIGNVVGALPLPIAVAHNAGAAFLLGLVLVLNYRLWYLD